MRTIIIGCMMIKSIIIFALLSQQMVDASPFFLILQAPQQQSQSSTAAPFLPFLGQRALPTPAPGLTSSPGPTASPGSIPPTPRIRSVTRTATSMAQQRQITAVAAGVQALVNALMTAKLNWFMNLITSGGRSMNQPSSMPTTATPITTLPGFVFMPPSNNPLNVSTPPAPPETSSELSTSAPAASADSPTTSTDSFLASTDSASAATDNPTSNPIDTTAAADTTLIPQAPTGNPVSIVVDPDFDLRRAYSESLGSGDDIEDNEDTSTVNSETESTTPNDTQSDNVRESDTAGAIPENDNDSDGSDESSFIKKPPPTKASRKEKKNKDRKEKEDTSTVNSETESTIPSDTQGDNVRESDTASAISENDNDSDGSDESSFIKKPPPTKASRKEKKNKDRREKEDKKKSTKRRLTSTKVSSKDDDDDDQRSFTSFSDIVGGILDAGVVTTEKSDSSDILTDGDVIKTKKIRAKPDNPTNLPRGDSDTDAITTIPRVKKYKKPKKSSSKKKAKANKKEPQGEEGGNI